MIKRAIEFVSKNSNAIQVLAAIVQSFIAALMLWTLWQNSEALATTRRQLEASIEPVVDMTMLGPIIRLTNSGSIEIRKIEAIAVISGYFDMAEQKISVYQVNNGRFPLSDILQPTQSYDLNLAALLAPPGSPKPPGSISVYCYVLRYRRSADMKPFIKLVPFIVEKDSTTLTTDVYLSLVLSTGGSEARTRIGGDDSFNNARLELLRLYQTRVAYPDLP